MESARKDKLSRTDSRTKRKHQKNDSDECSDRSRHERKEKSKRRSRQHKKRKKRSSSSGEDSDDSSDNDEDVTISRQNAANERLLAKLAARGETLEERKERRAQKRAARIAAKFGYTADDNPFNDPNLHEKFTWKKKEQQVAVSGGGILKEKDDTFKEIDKVRQRRKERELQHEEMERIRAEESRMKELENYDEWARKEEEFHLQQQRQRSAIRLVEGRERPIDVLAKNLLLFGLSEEEKKRASVKYRERYNAMDALETLEAELEDPYRLLRVLKMSELEELLMDIETFRSLEKEALASSTFSDQEHAILRYWDALRVVTEDELAFLKTGGRNGSRAKLVDEIRKIFQGQSATSLMKMRSEVLSNLQKHATDRNFSLDSEPFDRVYWQSVLEQLSVHLAKTELAELHAKMLVRQREKLEQRRAELAQAPEVANSPHDNAFNQSQDAVQQSAKTAVEASADDEDELGLEDEVNLHIKSYNWQDKYRPRKPRYFNRVKSGYDWNKYNQTHYDKDNPPPKSVHGYRFSIFYNDLIDPTKAPQYFIEPADSDDFCIIRFHAGPPYEDIAFKIINREWDRSRKRGFKSTFERGILTLNFNFKTHWYRR